MSVQVMNPNANAAQTLYTVNGCEATYGTIVIDETKRTFRLTVESSLVLDLIGQKLERACELSDKQLGLNPANPQGNLAGGLPTHLRSAVGGMSVPAFAERLRGAEGRFRDPLT